MYNITNRKTVQIKIEYGKTEINFDQNRKPQAKSWKTGRWPRSLRRIFSKGKPEKHQTAHRITNPKTRVYFCRKRKTESEIEQKLQTAIVINTQKPKFFCTKTGKSIYKMAETPKPKLPMSPLNSIGFESTYSVDSDFRFSVAASIL